MTTRILEPAMWPRSVAVFGASIREGSVGRVVIENIAGSGFEGDIWPVNPKYKEVAGHRCYKDAGGLPGVPDLGVIMTPPETVPGIIAKLGTQRVAGPLEDPNGNVASHRWLPDGILPL